MPNKELAAALRLARRATTEKRLFFALAVKGSNDGVLLVSRRKIPNTKVQAARKKCKATGHVTGTCYAGDGKLLFETIKKPSPQWKTLVRKLAQKETNLLVNAEFIQGRDEEDFEEAQFDVYEEQGDTAPDLAEEALAKKAAILTKLKDLHDDIEKAKKDKDAGGTVTRLREQVDRFLALPDYDAAERTLNNLTLLVQAALQSKKTGGRDLEAQKLIGRIKEMWPSYQEAINAPTSYRATLQQTLARANQHIKQKEYAEANQALTDLQELIVKALAVEEQVKQAEEKRVLKQGERYGKLSERLERVKNTSFTQEQLLLSEDPHLKPGKEFKAFLAAQRKCTAEKNKKNLQAVEDTALAYLRHYQNDLNDTQKKDNASLGKKRCCEEALKNVSRWRTALAWEKLGAPPWSPDQESEVAELYTKMIFEEGDKQATPMPQLSSNEMWWVDRDLPDGPDNLDDVPQGDLRRQHPRGRKYLFKPMDGESKFRGFPSGGQAGREVLGKALGDCLQSVTGLNLDVPETQLVTIDNSRLPDPMRMVPDPDKPPQRMGSLQHFAKSNYRLREKLRDQEFLERIPPQEIQKMALLDLISLNTDRHSGNFLVKEGEGGPQLLPIDHGLVLPTREGLFERRVRFGTLNNAVPQLPHSNEPFSEEMLAKIELIDEEAVLKSLKDAFFAMAKRHPEVAKTAHLSRENLELVRRSVAFLKKAARAGLTVAEIYDAYAQDLEKIFDSTEEEQEEQFQAAIVATRARTDARLQCEEWFLKNQGQEQFAQLHQLGWLLDVRQNQLRWCMQHAVLVVDILRNNRENQALLREMARMLAEMDQPEPQGTLPKRWEAVSAAYARFQQDRKLADPLGNTVLATFGGELSPEEVLARREDLLYYLQENGEDLLRRRNRPVTKMSLQERVEEFLQLSLKEPDQQELLKRAIALGAPLPRNPSPAEQAEAIRTLTAYERLGGDEEYVRLGGDDDTNHLSARLNALRELKRLEAQGQNQQEPEDALRERQEEALVQRFTQQTERHAKLSERMRTAQDSCFARGAEGQKGLLDEAEEAPRQGVKFKDFVAALKKANRHKTPENLDDLLKKADIYIEHFDRLEERQDDPESIKKRELCVRAKQDVARWRTALAWEALGAPPWDEQTESRAAELYAKSIFEDGNKRATLDGNPRDSLTKWWVDAPRKTGEVGHKYLFKPVDGSTEKMLGFPSGGEAPREVLGKALGDQLQTALGLTLGVPETHLVEIDNERLPDGDGRIDRTRPPQRLGSMQHFNKQGQKLSDRLEQDQELQARIPAEECQKMALLDLISLNMDRHAGNFLVEEQEEQQPRLVPIDHGLILPSKEGLKNKRSRLRSTFAVLPGLPGSREPFTEELRQKIDDLDEEEVIQGLRDSLQAMGQRHPQTVENAQVKEENLELVRRSIRFLKKAAAAQLPLADIYDAYAHDLEKIFESSEEELDRRFEEVITTARERSHDRTECERLVIGPQGDDNRQRLYELGWLPDIGPRGKDAEAWALEHPSLVLRILGNEPHRENSALRQELEGWLEQLPEAKRPRPTANLSQYWETVRDAFEKFQREPDLEAQLGAKAVRDLKKAFGKEDATPEEVVAMRQDLLDYKNGNGDQLLTKNGIAPGKLKLAEKILKFRLLQLQEPSTAKTLALLRARGANFEKTSNRPLSPEAALKKQRDYLRDWTEYERLGGDAEFARLGGLDTIPPVPISTRLKHVRTLQKLHQNGEALEAQLLQVM